MKRNILTSALAAVILFSTAAFTTSLKEKEVKVTSSKVTWTGKKVVGQHNGTVALKEGVLMFDGKDLKGGKFAMDMTTIVTTDDLGDYKAKLEGHLRSDDFFGVEKHPTATMDFTAISGEDGEYIVIADLTIKGITNAVKFDLKIADKKATTSFKVDRTKYDIKYGSGSFFDNLGDKAIDNEFELNVELAF